MKKLIVVIIVLFFPLFLVSASSPTAIPDEDVVYDSECVQRKLYGTPASSTGTEPICNIMCVESFVNAGIYCRYNTTDEFGGYWNAFNDLDTPLKLGPVDGALVFIRAALYAVMGAIAVAVVFYGLYGWYTHAISEGKPDKLEEVKKIYTNTVIGTIIIIMSFIIVQLISVFFGVTESVFDINFIPKYGFMVEVRDSDIGRVCYEEQIDKSSEGGSHTCVDGRWQ